MLLSGHTATQSQTQLSDLNSTKNRQKKETKKEKSFRHKADQLDLRNTPKVCIRQRKEESKVSSTNK